MLQFSSVMNLLSSRYQALWHNFSTQGQMGTVRAQQYWACGQRLCWDCPVPSQDPWQISAQTISGTSLFLAIPWGGFLKVWPKCHESATAAVQVAALPVPQFGQAKISPFEPSALSPWNTNCFPLPWRSHSLISLHPHLQLIPKRTGSVRNKASRRHST